MVNHHQNNTTITETIITEGYFIPVIVLGTVINSIIIFINSFLMVFMCRANYLRRNQPNIVFLISLIATHLAIGLGSFIIYPVIAVANASAETRKTVLYCSEFFFRFVTCNSYCILIVMLVDRLIAVKKPFIYQRFNHKHAGLVVLLTFTPPLVYLGFLGWSFDTVSMSCAFLYLFTGGFLVFGNLVIFLDVRKQLMKIRGLTKVSGDDHVCATGHKIFKKKLQKSILVSLIFSLSFLLLWIPFMTVVVVKVFNDTYHTSDKNMYILWNVGLLNSVFDPIVYVVLNKPVRKALLKALGCRRIKRNESTSTTASKATSESRN